MVLLTYPCRNPEDYPETPVSIDTAGFSGSGSPRKFPVSGFSGFSGFVRFSRFPLFRELRDFPVFPAPPLGGGKKPRTGKRGGFHPGKASLEDW